MPDIHRTFLIDIHSALCGVYDYLDNHADWDTIDGVPEPNQAARLLSDVTEVLDRLDRHLLMKDTQ
jgi:hypothetical protein